MRVFKTRWFARFARRERISDPNLCEAVWRAEGGLVDADLGGGVIKQRVARTGQGRSGAYRVLLAYRANARSVFLYGFAKSQRENVEDFRPETRVGTESLRIDSGNLERRGAVGRGGRRKHFTALKDTLGDEQRNGPR